MFTKSPALGMRANAFGIDVGVKAINVNAIFVASADMQVRVLTLEVHQLDAVLKKIGSAALKRQLSGSYF
jgi:hypothetical protein